MSGSSQSSDKQRWLQRIRRRLHFGLFLKHFTDWTVVFCMAIGCAFLATKLFWASGWPYMLWFLLLSVPLVFGAWWFSRRERYADNQSVALLDQRLGAGGLLMTVVESPDDQWEHQLPVANQVWKQAIPAVRPWRTLKHLALPILFLVFTSLIPSRTVQSMTAIPSTVSRTEVSRLSEMLEELDENEILKEEEKDEIEEQIKKLAKETRYKPLTHENWETVDALKQKMDLKLANRQNELQQIASALAALERSRKDADSQSDSDRQRLEDLLQKLNENRSGNPDSANRMDDLSKFSESNGNFKLPTNPEDLEAALEELSDFIESQCDKVGRFARKAGKPCDCEDCPEGGT